MTDPEIIRRAATAAGFPWHGDSPLAPRGAYRAIARAGMPGDRVAMWRCITRGAAMDKPLRAHLETIIESTAPTAPACPAKESP